MVERYENLYSKKYKITAPSEVRKCNIYLTLTNDYET